MAEQRGRYQPDVRRRIVDFVSVWRSVGLLARGFKVSEHMIRTRVE